jgi:prepilin-type N-terminal cleavage/methylation domain-containing protein
MMMRIYILRKKGDTDGFTIVEILIALSIFTIVGVVALVFQRDVLRLNAVLHGNLDAQQEARRTFRQLTRELRAAAPSSTGTFVIENAGTSTLTFYSDIDDDGLQDRLRYFLEGTTLKKGVIAPTGNPPTYNPLSEVIANRIHYIANTTTPIFEYFDTNYDGSTAPLPTPVNLPSVRLVKASVFIDRVPGQAPGPVMMTTQVTIRNLKDNL